MSATDDLNNPNLFDENQPGEYSYSENAYGKTASGQLSLSSSPERDPDAQRAAGGEDRRTSGNTYGVDDGGHLIGARFGGSVGQENLTPQDRNLNRGDYKRAENDWADRLENGDKVYVHMESYTGDGSNRPTNYMGYAIFEHTDENGNKTREIEYYSFNNESRAEQEQWEKDEEAFYQENPEAVQEQQKANTSMPYIWDDEKGDLVENPNYVDQGDTQVQNKENPYAPMEEETGEALDNPYTPSETVSTEVTDEYSYSPGTTEESVSTGVSADNSTESSSDNSNSSDSVGGSSGTGQDRD